MFVLQTSSGSGGGTPPDTSYQRGEITTVAGQQSYAVSLSPSFSATPVLVEAAMQLQGPGGSGEMFTVAVDRSTLAVTGFTLWLSGLPIAGGDTIEWTASI